MIRFLSKRALLPPVMIILRMAIMMMAGVMVAGLPQNVMAANVKLLVFGDSLVGRVRA